MINEAPYWSSSPISLYLNAMTIEAFYSILFSCAQLHQVVLVRTIMFLRGQCGMV